MIPAVILAAGRSSRMGRTKALLPIGNAGEVFVTHLITVLTEGGAEEIVVVVGADADAVRAAVAAAMAPARVIENQSYDLGQLSSVVTALDKVDRPGVRAMMLIPVDMPLVAPATVRALRNARARSSALVVRPAHQGRHGHPVIFDRTLFPDLRAADPMLGARAVVAAHRDRVLDVELDPYDPGAFVDIDTAEDYERHLGISLGGLRP